jgi:hypothetical protein
MTVAKAVLIGVPLLTVLACASGGSDDEETQGKKGSGDSAKGEVGNWDILTARPEFKKEFGMFSTVKLKVKNVSGSEDEPWLEIRLTNKAGDLVTTYDCIGDTVEAGQSTTLECSSLDDWAPFTDYEIKNAF